MRWSQTSFKLIINISTLQRKAYKPELALLRVTICSPRSKTHKQSGSDSTLTLISVIPVERSQVRGVTAWPRSWPVQVLSVCSIPMSCLRPHCETESSLVWGSKPEEFSHFPTFKTKQLWARDTLPPPWL